MPARFRRHCRAASVRVSFYGRFAREKRRGGGKPKEKKRSEQNCSCATLKLVYPVCARRANAFLTDPESAAPLANGTSVSKCSFSRVTKKCKGGVGGAALGRDTGSRTRVCDFRVSQIRITYATRCWSVWETDRMDRRWCAETCT